VAPRKNELSPPPRDSSVEETLGESGSKGKKKRNVLERTCIVEGAEDSDSEEVI
jgi:hypothetical protein